MATFHFIKGVSGGQIEEIRELYISAGWWSDGDDRNPHLIAEIISGSYCFCVAMDQGSIIGMARAISDGVSDAYIQDVTVRVDYRKKGIGSDLVRGIVEVLRRKGLTWIGLIATPMSCKIYWKIGFEEMPSRTPMLLNFKLYK